MKLNSARRDQGNTLITVTIFTGVLSILMLSYLTMARNSITLTSRSLVWNDTIPTAEAGIEEAAAAIQTVPYGKSLSAMLQTNGWTVSGNTLTKTRALASGSFSVLITSANTSFAIGPTNPPIICSTGYVAVPLRSGFISRTVQVKTKYNKPLCHALLAKNSIGVSGASSVFDSYDPANPAYSTGGLYDPAKYHDQAHVGCDSFAAGCVSVGSSKTYGDVNTQFGGTVSVGGSGVVGDKAYVNAGSGNNGTIQSGHSLNTLSAVFIDATVPFTAGATLAPATIGGVSYDYVADGTNYYFSGNMSLKNPLLVRSNATIYVTGSFDIGSGASINIQPNASLTIVIGGPSCSIGGNGVVNSSQAASACTFQCLPTCTSGTFNGGAQFVGTINAPQADWTMTGGAGFCGAATCKSFNLTGGMNIHYDESLARTVNNSLYSILSWSEL